MKMTSASISISYAVARRQHQTLAVYILRWTPMSLNSVQILTSENPSSSQLYGDRLQYLLQCPQQCITSTVESFSSTVECVPCQRYKAWYVLIESDEGRNSSPVAHGKSSLTCFYATRHFGNSPLRRASYQAFACWIPHSQVAECLPFLQVRLYRYPTTDWHLSIVTHLSLFQLFSCQIFLDRRFYQVCWRWEISWLSLLLAVVVIARMSREPRRVHCQARSRSPQSLPITISLKPSMKNHWSQVEVWYPDNV